MYSVLLYFCHALKFCNQHAVCVPYVILYDGQSSWSALETQNRILGLIIPQKLLKPQWKCHFYSPLYHFNTTSFSPQSSRLSFSFNFPRHLSFFQSSKPLRGWHRFKYSKWRHIHISPWQTWIASKINNVKMKLAIWIQIAHAALTIRQVWFWSLVPHPCVMAVYGFGLLSMICQALLSLTDRLTGMVMACLAHAQAWSWYALKKRALPSMRLREENKHEKIDLELQ